MTYDHFVAINYYTLAVFPDEAFQGAAAVFFFFFFFLNYTALIKAAKVPQNNLEADAATNRSTKRVVQDHRRVLLFLLPSPFLWVNSDTPVST